MEFALQGKMKKKKFFVYKTNITFYSQTYWERHCKKQRVFKEYEEHSYLFYAIMLNVITYNTPENRKQIFSLHEILDKEK